MKIIVASKNPVKVQAVTTAFELAFPQKMHHVEGIGVPSGVSDQPMSEEETRLGAYNRAQGAKDVDEAAAQIAIAHFNSGLTYVGVANYSTPFDFFLSDYLEKVNNIHSSPLPSNVNCTDCAAAISTLSNLAGHDLWQSKMRYFLLLSLNC